MADVVMAAEQVVAMAVVVATAAETGMAAAARPARVAGATVLVAQEIQTKPSADKRYSAVHCSGGKVCHLSN